MCLHEHLECDREGDHLVTSCTDCFETIAVERIDDLLHELDREEYQPADAA